MVSSSYWQLSCRRASAGLNTVPAFSAALKHKDVGAWVDLEDGGTAVRRRGFLNQIW